jgi:hypothetical protein
MSCRGRAAEWTMLGSEYGRLRTLLLERGYVEGRSGLPGSFAIVSQDGAPGWGEWMFWVVVEEDPARPALEDVGVALGRDGFILT